MTRCCFRTLLTEWRCARANQSTQRVFTESTLLRCEIDGVHGEAIVRARDARVRRQVAAYFSDERIDSVQSDGVAKMPSRQQIPNARR